MIRLGTISRLSTISRLTQIRSLSTSSSRFPPKKKGKAGAKGGKKGGADKGGEFSSPTITDPKQLQTVCIGLQLEEGGDDVTLKPDEEYPDWLWKMSVQPKYLPEHFEPGTEDYYKALEKSNWSLKTDRLKMRSYEHEDKYHLFNNFSSPLEEIYVKNQPESDLAKRLMEVEEVYINSKATRKTGAEFEKGFNPEVQTG